MSVLMRILAAGLALLTLLALHQGPALAPPVESDSVWWCDEVARVDILGMRKQYRRAHDMQTVRSDGSESFSDDGAPDLLWAAGNVESLGVETVQVFGSYVLGRVSEEALERLRAAKLYVEFEPPPVVSIGGHRFNPCQGEPDLSPDLRITSVDPSEQAYLLVQIPWGLNRTWRGEWWRHRLNQEVQLLQYVYRNTFIVRTPASQVELLKELPFIGYVGFYHPAYKISPRINMDPWQPWQSDLSLVVTLHEGENGLRAAEKIDAVGGHVIEEGGRYLRVIVAPERVPHLAQIAAVYYLSLWEPSTIAAEGTERSLFMMSLAILMGVALIVGIVVLYRTFGRNQNLQS